MNYRDDNANDDLATAVAAAPVSRRREVLFDYLGALTAKILNSPTAEIPKLNNEHRLFELGLSSLFIVELKNQLEEAVHVELPLTLFFTHADLGSLADYLIDEVLAPTDNHANAPTPSVASSDDPDANLVEHEDPEAALLRKIAEVDEKY